MPAPNTTVRVNVVVNGAPTEHDVEARTLLVQYLRDVVGLTGTNIGCDTTSCGACTVLLDGESVKSCTVLAVQADGGASPPSRASPAGGELHPMQAAFREHHGLQCGYCTPGMVMAAVSLARGGARELDEAEVREGLEGNLCRCTGYHNIVAAVLAALPPRHGGRHGDPGRVRLRPRRLGRRRDRAARRARRRRQAPRRRALAPAADEAAARHAVGARRRRPADRPLVRARATATRSPSAGSTRHHDLETDPLAATARADLAARRPPRSAIRRSATAAPSAARSPTAIPRPTCPRWCSRCAARIVVAGTGGERVIAADDFFRASSRPRSRPTRSSPRSGCRSTGGAGWSFQKFNRRAQDWAIVGVAAVGGASPASPWSTWVPRRSGPKRSRPRCSAGASPADAAAVADDGTDPPSDLNASPEFRRHLRRCSSAGARHRRRR